MKTQENIYFFTVLVLGWFIINLQSTAYLQALVLKVAHTHPPTQRMYFRFSPLCIVIKHLVLLVALLHIHGFQSPWRRHLVLDDADPRNEYLTLSPPPPLCLSLTHARTHTHMQAHTHTHRCTHPHILHKYCLLVTPKNLPKPLVLNYLIIISSPMG